MLKPGQLPVNTCAVVGKLEKGKRQNTCDGIGFPWVMMGYLRFGSKADKRSRAEIHLCPLLSESGQNFAVRSAK
jgi:hypothetical protein